MHRSLLIILFGLIISASVHAKMFKWVDNKGKTHYGDTIPAEYADQGNEQLDKRAQVVKKTDPALTPAQIKQRDDNEAAANKEKEEALEAQRRDKALLATYTVVKEIDASLQRNLGQLDVQIQSYELRIKSTQGRLTKLKEQEAGFVQRKKPVPPDVLSGIKSSNDELVLLQGNIARLNQDKNVMRNRFAADKARFCELKGLPAEPTATAPTTVPAVTAPVAPQAPAKPTSPTAPKK